MNLSIMIILIVDTCLARFSSILYLPCSIRLVMATSSALQKVVACLFIDGKRFHVSLFFKKISFLFLAYKGILYEKYMLRLSSWDSHFQVDNFLNSYCAIPLFPL